MRSSGVCSRHRTTELDRIVYEKEALGFRRLPQIIGDKRATPPIQPRIPVSRSTWWQGVRDGIFPKPVKIGPRISAWREEDIRELIERLGKRVTP